MHQENLKCRGKVCKNEQDKFEIEREQRFEEKEQPSARKMDTETKQSARELVLSELCMCGT